MQPVHRISGHQKPMPRLKSFEGNRLLQSLMQMGLKKNLCRTHIDYGESPP